MSIIYMGFGWKLDLEPTELLVYLAIADHVDDDGEGCYASYKKLALKTNLDRSTIIRSVERLEKAGILVHQGTHPQYGTNVWNIDKDRVLELAKFQENGNKRSTLHGGTESTDRTMRIFAALATRDGLRCRVPGCRNEDLQIDHIIPRARHGNNELANLQLLCAHHNQIKNARDWNDFLQDCWEHFRRKYEMMQEVLQEWNALGFSLEDDT